MCKVFCSYDTGDWFMNKFHGNQEYAGLFRADNSILFSMCSSHATDSRQLGNRMVQLFFSYLS